MRVGWLIQVDEEMYIRQAKCSTHTVQNKLCIYL